MGCLAQDTVTWPTPFANANYNAVCTGTAPSDGRAGPIFILSKTAANMVIEPVTEGSIAIFYGEVDCHAVGTLP